MPARGQWRDFEDAREYVRGLGLKGQREWHEYCKAGEKPKDIPSNPHRTYKGGWLGYGDWLGTGYVANRERGYRPFEEAREFVRSLGLKGQRDWFAYARSGNRPNDIPATPWQVYESEWQGLGDWLGAGQRRDRWRPFGEAREFARSLGLKSQTEWQAWAKTGTKPDDVPATPYQVYKDEWLGYGDWLGTGNRKGGWRSFEEARALVRSLGLKGSGEWREYCSKSGKLPDDIPTAPHLVYNSKQERGKAITESTNGVVEEQGEWRGWADWLGVVSKWTRTTLLAFLEDLRPRLKDLEETELYLILQQGGAMPGLQKALGKSTALGVLKDLKENDGRALEAALEAAADGEIADSYAEDDLPAKEEDEALQVHTPEDEELDEDLLEAGGLASLATPEALRLVDDLAGMHYGLDDETAQYLVDNRIAGLWQACTDDGEAALEALKGDGGHYFQLIRNRFNAELEGAKNLPIPAGWAFRAPEVSTKHPHPQTSCSAERPTCFLPARGLATGAVSVPARLFRASWQAG